MIYALHTRDNFLIHIHEAKNGRQCECVCPQCSQPLIAKQGEINQNHFAHVANATNKDACNFDLVKSCTRKLIEELCVSRQLYSPVRNVSKTVPPSEPKGRLLALTEVRRLPSVDGYFTSVECRHPIYSSFIVSFQTTPFAQALHKNAGDPKRFLIIDVFAFIESFDRRATINNSDLISLLYRDSLYKRANDQFPVNIIEGTQCCLQLKNRITNHCLSCGRKLKK
jgi:hypothetical protein